MNNGPPPTDLRAAAAGWLREQAPAFALPERELSVFQKIDDETAEAQTRLAQQWQHHKYVSGWAALSLPPELGGRGLSRADDVVFTDEESRYSLPTHVLEVTTRMVLPTLVTWAPENRESITDILTGRDVWCQLFSEPGAGSDLAALTTRATRQADGTWVVSGQKVWTSWAHIARKGYLLARTGGPGHKGITAFEVDMSAPGISVRRLTQSPGARTFNEVFLDDVRLPADATIGPVGQGWSVAMTTLMNERLAVGADQLPYDQLHQEAERRGLLHQSDVATALGALRARGLVLVHLRHQMLEAVRDGGDPGAEGSAAKLYLGESVHAAAALARRLRGADLLRDDAWSQLALSWPGVKNAGGTDEIQKTIIADRILGLPREQPGGPTAARPRTGPRSGGRQDEEEREFRRQLHRIVAGARSRSSLHERLAQGYVDDATTRRQITQLGLLEMAQPEELGSSRPRLGHLLAGIEEAALGLVAPDLFVSAGLALAAALAARRRPSAVYDELVTLSTRPTSAAWPGVLAGDCCLNLEGAAVTGSIEYLALGATAEQLIAVLPTDAGAEVRLIDLTGTRVTPVESLDPTRPCATVELSGAASIRLGDISTADVDLLRATWLLALAADNLGAMSGALDAAVIFASERVAFGRPIGSFQAVRHRCADMFVDVETTRASVRAATASVEREDPESLVSALAAASHSIEAFTRVAESSTLVYGALGFTAEASAHFYLRRAYSNSVLFGPVEALQAQLARR